MKNFTCFLLIMLSFSCNKRKEEKNQVPQKNDVLENKQDKIDKIKNKENNLEQISRLSIIDSINNRLNNQEYAIEERLEVIKYQIEDLNKALSNTNKDSIYPIFWNLCSEYYKMQRKIDSIKKPKIDSIQKGLLLETSSLSANQLFVNELLAIDTDTTRLLIEKPIYPIYNINDSIVGAYNDSQNYAETLLLKRTDHRKKLQENYEETIGQLILYDNILNFSHTETYMFSLSNKYKSNFKRFGRYEDECLAYNFYESDLYKIDDFMFGSKYNLDLEYINNPEIDLLLSNYYLPVCQDCPNDYYNQKSFAKLKGFDNLYFTYAFKKDTRIDDVNTPIRALVYFKDNFFFYLWITEIDLFGCSCL